PEARVHCRRTHRPLRGRDHLFLFESPRPAPRLPTARARPASRHHQSQSKPAAKRPQVRPPGTRVSGRTLREAALVTTFRVLGPLEVVREGRRTRPTGKPAAVLVALLLRRGEVVPAETLLGDVWEDRPPQSAAKLLQAHVSQLRKLLGRNRLQTVGSGYVVAVEPEEVDLA